MKLERVSSTRIGNAKDCLRRYGFVTRGEVEEEFGSAAAIGSLFHSIKETELLMGFFPTAQQLYHFQGNYSDPKEHMARWPRAYDVAAKMARAVGDPRAYIPEEYELEGVEVCLDDMGVEVLPGVLAGGYFDLLGRHKDEPGVYWIGDWKTRGPSSWKARPRTEADFASNIQFTYYAASLAQARPDLKAVRVDHINVLRPPEGQRVDVRVDGSVYTRAYLDMVWAWLRDEMVPAMVAAVADPTTAPKDLNGCWAYGKPCPAMAKCQKAEAKGRSFLAWAQDTGLLK